MSGPQPLGNSSISSHLSAAWSHYRQNMIASDGRPLADADTQDLDFDNNESERVTYSEAAAYTLLRAVLINDQGTFDRVWSWSQNNLQRVNIDNVWVCSAENQAGACTDWSAEPLAEQYRDHLFAWRWVDDLNGSQAGSPSGIIRYRASGGIDRSGYNAASDDIEIAAALYLASLRGWGDACGDDYLDQAQLILQDAWDNYVRQVGNEYYFFAGDMFSWSGELNPSYFRPAYFNNIFAAIDPTHPWDRVANSSYDVITRSGSMELDGRRGANLPPNWLAMDFRGQLVSSRMFDGPAGETFGRDAIRTLWAVAQDAAWFNDPQANRYLTDPSIGPQSYLSNRLHPGRYAETGFHHDGRLIRGEAANTPQTAGLASEQIFMYGPYLAYFHYADNVEMREAILQRLDQAYNSDGYWGSDSREYYTQNWIWLGLFLANGPAENDDLFARMSLDLDLRRDETAPAATTLVETHLLQPDARLGRRDNDLRPILDRRLLANNMNVDQLKQTLDVIIGTAGSPVNGLSRTQLQQLRQLDQASRYNLLPYFTDRDQYWNNVITLLSAYAQLATRSEDQAVQLEQAMTFCGLVRDAVSSGNRISNGPSEYSRSMLDLTEAEIRAQLTVADIGFYEQGLFLATTAIYSMLDINRQYARPDYSVITKALITIGDLNLRLHEVTRGQDNEINYMERAAEYYGYAANANTEIGTVIEDEQLGLYLNYCLEDANDALQFNHRQGYLSQQQYASARNNLHVLRAIAAVKAASLIVQRPEQRTIANIIRELMTCNRAIAELSATNTEFFLPYARIVKADLQLLLADNIKYHLWPYAENGTDLAQLQQELTEISVDLLTSEDYPQDDIYALLFDLEILLGQLQNSEQGEATDSMFTLNNRLTDEARDLYRQTPDDFAYLFAWSHTKLSEIGVRTAFFMDNEFGFLMPFYTNRTLQSGPIPHDSFLGIEQTYLRALMLASADQEEEALGLFNEVIETAADNLDPNYSVYFQVHCRLKIAEIHAQRYSRTRVQAERQQAIALFTQIDRDLNALPESTLTQMSWRPNSLRAELYQEWSNLTGSLTLAEQALEMCYLSDSLYDFRDRRDFILMRHNFNSRLLAFDQQLQTRYGRDPDIGR